MAGKLEGFAMDLEFAGRARLRSGFPGVVRRRTLDAGKVFSLCGRPITDGFG